jgi:hypothetical protein
MIPLVLLTVAAPAIVVEDGVEAKATVEARATRALSDMTSTFVAVAHVDPFASAPPFSEIRVRPASALGPIVGAKSTPGIVYVRKRPDEAALVHEIAHQFLFAACPIAFQDRLFHEAFAMSMSGEIAAWNDAPYLSIAKAEALLEPMDDLETKRARSALARILADAPSGTSGLAVAIERRIKRCASGSQRLEPLTVRALVGEPYAIADAVAADAFVVISRHSGETLFALGAIQTPMPYGSVLKPFLAAGARARKIAPPLLSPDPERVEWACGERDRERFDLETALARSCNGYFLDWAKSSPSIGTLGPYGALLVSLGLEHAPMDVTEAIGLRPTFHLRPWSIGQAYRALAQADPAVIAMLKSTARIGTLSGLEASAKMSGVALKTGTVRDAASRPVLGWIVAIDEDVVAVMTRRGRAPRTFFGELARAFVEMRKTDRDLDRVARVQAFGLLSPSTIEARCSGVSFFTRDDGTIVSSTVARFSPLLPSIVSGEALCLGAPWRIRFPGSDEEGREYAGVFTRSPPPPFRSAIDALPISERARRARTGSEIVFRTTRLAYTLGVVAAEDSGIEGEARVALARVVAHNADVDDRHRGRPVCDTTHCQTFRGTVRAKAADLDLLRGGDLPYGGWLPFSKGGDTAWETVRSASEVENVLGPGAFDLRFGPGRVRYLIPELAERAAVFEDVRDVSCEPLRAALHLLACPREAVHDGDRFVFRGRGEGHGEGLDVEHAKQSAASEAQILDEAYGRHDMPAFTR